MKIRRTRRPTTPSSLTSASGPVHSLSGHEHTAGLVRGRATATEAAGRRAGCRASFHGCDMNSTLLSAPLANPRALFWVEAATAGDRLTLTGGLVGAALYVTVIEESRERDNNEIK